MQPCRPSKHNFVKKFLNLSEPCHLTPAKSKQEHPQIFFHPSKRKYLNPSMFTIQYHNAIRRLYVVKTHKCVFFIIVGHEE